MSLPTTLNLEFIDGQCARWKADPSSVSSDWRAFFEGFSLGAAAPAHGSGQAPAGDAQRKQSRVDALIHRYRDLGHLLACMDPMSACPVTHPLLELEALGLSSEDLETAFHPGGVADLQDPVALKDLLAILRQTYCRTVGVEYMHLQDPTERRWLQERMEPVRNRPALARDERRRVLRAICQASRFEAFLNQKYLGQTRFSLEGGETLMPLLDALAEHVAARGCREIILGMAHRGRLNVQAHLLGKAYRDIFAEFENCYDPTQLTGAGDVKYHNGYLADTHTAGGHPLKIFLVNNPSHLEAVDPVVQGIARGRQDQYGSGPDARSDVLPLLLHGDAAFAGQGVVAETLNMSQLSGYGTGGTLHVVLNNQIGYTTAPADARSTRYATDVAKMLMVPIFHVHGEDPEAAAHVIRLAADYRYAFGKDVVVDLVCYRRHGHNEGDEPYFTQPRMYARIHERPGLERIYADQLIEEDIVTREQVDELTGGIEADLQQAFDEIRQEAACPFPQYPFYDHWDGYRGTYREEDAAVITAVDAATLTELTERLTRLPDGFTPHDKIAKLLERRRQAVTAGTRIDWANAETLAFASLLHEGIPVRLSGQDSARGTFSQRHSLLVDRTDGRTRCPLNELGEGAASFQVHNSLLAEYAVLGYEYGYALARPECLTLWEAQFGDFANNAQAVIDLFIASGEAKWQRLNGLVLLLPHGMEGLGPEHSSARLERFLQLCAEGNLQVCYPSTPAQYFHLLRRQMRRALRKPLVVMTPKSLLRLPAAVSSLTDLTEGAFQEVLADPQDPKGARRVLLCSGKIVYALLERRRAVEAHDTAVVCLEQLYPFPQAALQELLGGLPATTEVAWVQEEPANMGAWQFVAPRLAKLLPAAPEYIGRPPAASPATGFPAVFRKQHGELLNHAVGRRSSAQQGLGG